MDKCPEFDRFGLEITRRRQARAVEDPALLRSSMGQHFVDKDRIRSVIEADPEAGGGAEDKGVVLVPGPLEDLGILDLGGLDVLGAGGVAAVVLIVESTIVRIVLVLLVAITDFFFLLCTRVDIGLGLDSLVLGGGHLVAVELEHEGLARPVALLADLERVTEVGAEPVPVYVPDQEDGGLLRAEVLLPLHSLVDRFQQAAVLFCAEQ